MWIECETAKARESLGVGKKMWKKKKKITVSVPRQIFWDQLNGIPYFANNSTSESLKKCLPDSEYKTSSLNCICHHYGLWWEKY